MVDVGFVAVVVIDVDLVVIVDVVAAVVPADILAATTSGTD